MKKIILLAFCISISTVIFAQGTEWGVKAGYKMLDQSANASLSESKIRHGGYAGLFAEHKFNKFFGIQGELLYWEMEGKWEYQERVPSEPTYDNPYPYSDTDISVTDRTGYIILPVMAKFYMVKGLSFDFGPQFGYLVRAKHKSKSERTNGSYYNSVDKKFDASFGAGLSYKLNSKFDISGRCNINLIELADNGNLKNYMIQVGVGYRLR